VRARTLALLLVLTLAAGCLGLADDDPATSSTDTDTPTDANEDDQAPAASDDAGPFQREPAWLPGEHWTAKVDSRLLDEPLTWTRVVAGFSPQGYLVGQPAEEARPGPLLLHIPGMGLVQEANLSYQVHGDAFQPVSFPLEEGKTWQTTFEGDPVNATVERVGEDQARIEFCCSRNITVVYDAQLRAVASMTVDDGFLAYEVTDHGFAHEGLVEVPLQREIVFFEGRFAGATGLREPAGPPTNQADVSGDHDRVAFTQIVGNADATPAPATGVYREQATLPNGTTVATQQAASTEGLTITFHEAANASGTWRFEHVAAGAGLAVTEGIGYQAARIQAG
jgi:hypothetical protein